MNVWTLIAKLLGSQFGIFSSGALIAAALAPVIVWICNKALTGLLNYSGLWDSVVSWGYTQFPGMVGAVCLVNSCLPFPELMQALIFYINFRITLLTFGGTMHGIRALTKWLSLLKLLK